MKYLKIKTDGKVERHPDHISALDTIVIATEDNGVLEVSDGFHTIEELYEHRIQLFIALCRAIVALGAMQDANEVWRSKIHSDGTFFKGWFIVGIGKNEGEQITYHLPESQWEKTNFIFELPKAPEWDKHTAHDVLERLSNLLTNRLHYSETKDVEK